MSYNHEYDQDCEIRALEHRCAYLEQLLGVNQEQKACPRCNRRWHMFSSTNVMTDDGNCICCDVPMVDYRPPTISERP